MNLISSVIARSEATGFLSFRPSEANGFLSFRPRPKAEWRNLEQSRFLDSLRSLGMTVLALTSLLGMTVQATTLSLGMT